MASEIPDFHERFNAFLSGKTADRVFVHPISHPSKTEFCACDKTPSESFGFFMKGFLLHILLQLPWNEPKIRLLRKLGAEVGKNVYLSLDVWIDPLFPYLLTVENDVLIGAGAKFTMHEYRQTEFRAGRIIIRQGAIIGGDALITCGVEIGEYSTVAYGAVVTQDVPSRMTAIGNPARLVRSCT